MLGTIIMVISVSIALCSLLASIYFNRRRARLDAKAEASKLQEQAHQDRVLRLLASHEFEVRVTEIVLVSQRVRDFIGDMAMEAVTERLQDSETLQAFDKVLGILEQDVADVRRMIIAAISRDPQTQSTASTRPVDQLPIKRGDGK